MSSEEFFKLHHNLIKVIAGDDEVSEQFLEILIEKAWNAGYEFRIQEEELNRGASF